MTRSSRIVRTLAVLAAALVLLCTACGSGRPPPRPVVSRYETTTGHRVVRDCGFSVPLPGPSRHSLWLFCDTLVTSRHGQVLGNPILGAGTAAEGPYTAGRGPGLLTELATPGNILGPPVQVFAAQPGQQLPQPQALGSPVFRGGYLYLFGWCGPDCDRGGVFLARTSAATAGRDNGFTYQYWTGGGWSADL